MAKLIIHKLKTNSDSSNAYELVLNFILNHLGEALENHVA